jgi:leucyl aminopeptidase
MSVRPYAVKASPSTFLIQWNQRMKLESTNLTPIELSADAIVVGVHEEGVLPAPTAAVDEAVGGVITKLRDSKQIEGKANELTPLLGVTGVAAAQVLVVGLGDSAEFGRGQAYRAAAAAAKSLSAKERGTVGFYLADGLSDDILQAAIAGAMVGCQGQDLHRAEKKQHPFETLVFAAHEETVAAGQAIGEAVNLTRRLVNEPANKIYPISFAQVAEDVASSTGLEIEIWDEERLKAERCGSLLGVAQGSDHPPRLVVLRHKKGAEGDPTLALVGKGVTFDSGGLSLKTGNFMDNMKLDMSGAASVLGAMQAIATLDLPINAVGLMGLVENMPSGKAYRVGDVLTARNGKTIEVLNTDAEGRLVLADVLAVANDEGADRIIDLATLTGACVVALGLDVAGLMSNDQPWCDAIAAAADTCGERVWQLPMFEEFGDQLKGSVADLKNMGDGRWAGAITAAKFLEEFVDGTPWTHIDIAGPAFVEKSKPWVEGGGSGCLVRTLIEVAKTFG